MSKILLVDDEIKVLSAMKRLILFEGWEVVHVPDGIKALELLEESQIDLVITDYRMPLMDGMELASIIKEKYKNIPVILLTAYTDRKLVLKAFEDKTISSIITKPWDEDTLLEKIRSFLSSKNGENNEAAKNVPIKVLVMEDDRMTRFLYENWIKPKRFELKIAISGKNGFEIYQSWKPDILIMDLGLPDLSGYSVLKKIRLELEDKDTPIIVATSRNDADDVKSCMNLGIQGYMIKPFSGRQIIGEIVRCIDSIE
ncbi:hypothetical protein MTBBW1_750044 [Desulfamplus magnetovallimortis]|uniref:Response regulatory domain-containing protein n=1 Tax=Desulfamplus magnetovallimortis TaxID=1246637 RepID=A0A1W1HJ95_9BACT|nr:response regulator [Desulfamplus magnetovallimortis]SLM32523.1 hypothetical protein MTBBW1_750044 [Desulfamplus magnetovallimortis]